MNRKQKALTIIAVTSLASIGLFGLSFGQINEKGDANRVRRIEQQKLSLVVPPSFNYERGPVSLNNFGEDTASVAPVIPSSFVNELVITIHDQIRREQQSSDEDIMRRQKKMVEGIRRKK
jgi:hypothetical protein